MRSLMYKWECERSEKYKLYGVKKPTQFELNVNYRSHNGILQLASSIVDIIHHFFPDCIDSLKPETSEVGGPRPVVFSDFRMKAYFDGLSTNEGTSNIEFGAQQVIIVRNDETKLYVKEQIRDAGLVMTIFETKGMEFNDVLLFNFFTDSPAGSKVNCLFFTSSY